MKASSGLLPVLFVVLELGCNTGLVSIGDDRMLACEPEDCGEMPSDSPVCSELSMGRYECGQAMNETCSWLLSCPSDSCPSSACGVAPAERPMCLDGAWGSGWACDPVGVGCRWQGICPEQARECPPEDCGMPSGPVAVCMGEVTLGLSCLRAETDACRWTSVACALPP